MESFNDVLTRWQPFFTTVAGVAATLAGLLFVSLSLNRDKITAQENRILWRLAQRSFGDFMYALFIALMYLVPNHVPYALGIPLIIVATFRVGLLGRSIYRRSKRPLHNPTGFQAFREYSFQALSGFGLMAVGIEICLGNFLITFVLVPVIALLLYNASFNAWMLLIVEKGADSKDST